MPEIREGVPPTRPSVEISPDVGIVALLKSAEEKASTRKFIEISGDVASTANMAIREVGNLLGMGTDVRTGTVVVDEMVKLGVEVKLGGFSISARADDKEKVEAWKQKGVKAPPVLTIKIGSEEFTQRDSSVNAESMRNGEYVVRALRASEAKGFIAKLKAKRDVRTALEGLSNLSPKDIAKVLREQIEAGQNAVFNHQKNPR